MDSFVAALKLLSGAATFAVMFGSALRITPEMLRRMRENRRLLLRTFLVVWIAVPVFTALVILLLGVRGQSAALLLLMSVCPGVPLLLASTRTVRGAVATAFVVLVLTAASEPVLIPSWTRLISRFLPIDLTVQPKHVLDVLMPTVFLPIALGFIVRDISVGTRVLARLSDVVYVVGVVASVIAVGYQGLPVLPLVPVRAIVAAWIITVGDAVFGYWAGAPNIEDRKAIAVAAALGNPALALAVVEASYPEVRAVFMVAVYLVVRGTATLPLELVLRGFRKVKVMRQQGAEA